MELRTMALAAAVAAIPFTASAAVIGPGDTVDIADAPFFFSEMFQDADTGQTYDFTFTNTGASAAALAVTKGTVNQFALIFDDGVTVQWLDSGDAASIMEGADLEIFEVSTLIEAGGSDILRLTFGDPIAREPGGEGNIDFAVRASIIPLPASVLMLAGALGGLAMLGRRRKS